MIDIDISTPCTKWPSVEDMVRKTAQATLDQSGFKSKKSELSIVLADDPFVRSLNKNYRNKDKATNVLSFPQDDPRTLGDVVLAYETVKKEALAQRKSFDHHVMHLIIHGILHLLGHDHESDKDAEKMESIEIRILKSFGVKNPYETKHS